MRKIAPVLAALLATTSAIAAETMTYTYDAHGRLTKVQRAGGNNNAVTSQYSYDPSDNRTNAWQNSGAPPAPPAAPLPAFSISDTSVGEGDVMVFTVTRHRSFAPPVGFNVNFATSNGSAIAGSDYTATSGTLNFGADDYTRTISVPTTVDTNPESNETLTVTLSGATGGATIIDATGAGTIIDNDSSNQPPVASTDYGSAWICGGAVSFDVIANDSDPDGNLPLQLDAIVSTTNGTASIESATHLLFTPTIAGQGSGIVTYRVRDSLGATAQGTLYVQITGQGPCQ